MRARALERLAGERFDLLVVGAGIHGACIASSAARAGQRVALVERADFGAGASANSLKILHGGLRYLQHVDLPRFRRSVIARREWCRFAPGLVQPLPCVMPLAKAGVRSPWMLGPALLLNATLSADRNAGVVPSSRLPAGGLLSAARCRAMLAPLAARRPFAGALWWDAVMLDSERLLVNIVMAAADAGAVVANRVEALQVLASSSRTEGVVARDVEGGREFEIRAGTTIVAGGPGIDALLPTPASVASRRWVLAVNVVLGRSLGTEVAVALAAPTGGSGRGSLVRKQGRELFFVPWANRTMVGTGYVEMDTGLAPKDLRDRALAALLSDIRAAAPDAAVQDHDVSRVHWGALPADPDAPLEPLRSAVVASPGPGLVTVIGEKFTSAPVVAQQALSLAGLRSVPLASTARRDDREDRAPRLPQRIVDRYGAGAALRLAPQFATQEDARALPGSDVTVVEVRHAVQAEMATTLADVVLRRTGLAAAGCPAAATLEACAGIVAQALGWKDARVREELASVAMGWPWAPDA